ncbi:MAG: hypothetical protein NUV54_00755 [Candidatus Taylorbacteria bacterium]|nr:hypothetical protein [Candidatus Taylorbacteria bacterium]
METQEEYLTPLSTGHELVGKEVVGIVNLEPKQIGKHVSETLTLGFADENGNVVLAHPGKDVPVVLIGILFRVFAHPAKIQIPKPARIPSQTLPPRGRVHHSASIAPD